MRLQNLTKKQSNSRLIQLKMLVLVNRSNLINLQCSNHSNHNRKNQRKIKLTIPLRFLLMISIQTPIQFTPWVKRVVQLTTRRTMQISMTLLTTTNKLMTMSIPTKSKRADQFSNRRQMIWIMTLRTTLMSRSDSFLHQIITNSQIKYLSKTIIIDMCFYSYLLIFKF